MDAGRGQRGAVSGNQPLDREDEYTTPCTASVHSGDASALRQGLQLAPRLEDPTSRTSKAPSTRRPPPPHYKSRPRLSNEVVRSMPPRRRGREEGRREGSPCAPTQSVPSPNPRSERPWADLSGSSEPLAHSVVPPVRTPLLQPLPVPPRGLLHCELVSEPLTFVHPTLGQLSNQFPNRHS